MKHIIVKIDTITSNYDDEANPIETESTEYLVDACYEMILKLNELNML